MLLRELVDQLPDTHRDALLLRDLEELPTQEVATLLGISSNAVKIRVHRARHALRTLFERRLRGTTPAVIGEGR
jgi:RNA polymerase sigma-70 factor (ECF subfamily)